MIIKETEKTKFPFKTSEGRSFDRLHLSTIYGDLEKELFPPKDTGNPYWAEVGFLFEEALEEALSKVLRGRAVIRVGEIELDNVVGSPDGVDFENCILEEYKCTWKSSKKTPDQIWKYMVQIKGYLRMLDMDTCKMRILYLMGDYRGSGPQYKEFLITFTQAEINTNWDMLISHAKRKRWL